MKTPKAPDEVPDVNDGNGTMLCQLLEMEGLREVILVHLSYSSVGCLRKVNTTLRTALREQSCAGTNDDDGENNAPRKASSHFQRFLDYMKDREILLIYEGNQADDVRAETEMLYKKLHRSIRSGDFRIESSCHTETYNSLHGFYQETFFAPRLQRAFWGTDRFADYDQMRDEAIESFDYPESIREYFIETDGDSDSDSDGDHHTDGDSGSKHRSAHACQGTRTGATTTSSDRIPPPLAKKRKVQPCEARSCCSGQELAAIYPVKGRFYCGACLDTYVYLAIQFGIEHTVGHSCGSTDWYMEEEDCPMRLKPDEYSVSVWRFNGEDDWYVFLIAKGPQDPSVEYVDRDEAVEHESE